MTHVHIRNHPTHGHGAYQLVVDGIDLSMHVLTEGFKVAIPDQDEPARVTITIAADTLDVDLPDVVLDALRAHEAEAS